MEAMRGRKAIILDVNCILRMWRWPSVEEVFKEGESGLAGSVEKSALIC